MKYIKISESFALRNSGVISSPNIFIPQQTNKGQWVCDADCIKQFPELFKRNNNLEEVELDPKDFQPDYSKLEFVVDKKYSLKMRIEDYYEKKVTLIYIVNGEEVKVVKEIKDEAVTKTGYSVDMEDTVRKEEAAKDEAIKNRSGEAQLPEEFIR